MITPPPKQLSLWQRFWQHLEAIPVPKSEDSFLLRIFVQTLVVIGIIATDIAAEPAFPTSLWAVPLSLLGATWSWQRRKYRNIGMKFIIALGMVVVLIVFLMNLIKNLNNSQWALAQLLIQLQILHSFDLPRRKDLGYSIVIGLILLGVAGTLSQTLTFMPVLLLFLIVALPTLILDYRSRLGLKGLENIVTLKGIFKAKNRDKSQFIANSALSPRRLTRFILIILGLGLTVFLLLPRISSYQVQYFPMDAPEELQDETFNGRNERIVNPGYTLGGNNGQGGGGQSKTQGPGEVDQTFYYGFNEIMNQNLRGQMKPQVVLRVRSQAPGFWRVMAFDHYTGQGWEISRKDQLSYIRRSRWSYQFFNALPRLFGRTKPVIQSYTAVQPLPNILPSLLYPQNIFFPTRQIGVDPEGNLRSPVGLLEGLTYTVVSRVPYRDRTVLREAPQIYPDTISKYYLNLPPEIKAKVREKTEELLAKAWKSPGKNRKAPTSAYEKALYLAQALKQTYQIKPNLPYFSKDEDLVSAFLFRYQGGYPDHFSTVLTVMLRSIGIPARLAVGFGTGDFNPFTGYYVVRNTDAYALTEVYIADYGWFAFDPIPGHDVIPPSPEEDQTFSALKTFWNWVASWLPSPILDFIDIFWNKVITVAFQGIKWFWDLISGSFIGFLAGIMGAILVGFLGWIGLAQGRAWVRRRRLAKLHPMERFYLQMLTQLSAKGYQKGSAQTPSEYVQNLPQHYSPTLVGLIDQISQSYVSWRYGEQSPDVGVIKHQYQSFLKMLKQVKINHNKQ